jgi:rod shape-determining protein MreC
MRKLLGRRKVVIGAVVLLFLFSLNGISGEVRNFMVSVSSPLQAGVWKTGDSIATFFAGGNLKKEHELLRQENFALLQQVVSLQDLQKENEELRTILHFNLQEEFSLVRGEIIGKDLGKDTITVRTGKHSRIKEGMPVITVGKVAVGKIVEVFAESAKIQLLSAKGKKLDVKVAESGVAGVVKGEGGQRMVLDLVPQEDELHVGDIVVTSALGNVFPENILIGQVGEVIRTGSDPFQKAALEPFFNLKTVEFVLVVVS